MKKNYYLHLLILSTITMLIILLIINILQISVIPVIILFSVGLLLLLIMFRINKKIAHTIEQLELLFMFGVFIGLLYLGYSLFTAGSPI